MKLSEVEERAMYQEIQDQLLEFVAKNLLEIEAMVLVQLKDQLGFGEKRLVRFYENMNPTIYDLMVREIKYSKGAKPPSHVEKLKEYGIDLEALCLAREERLKEDVSND
jgi:hypothetical protein